mgnify:CR=1 FL=1|tara:strand:+ start:55202 stop:56044 length:843 start_codon:yes stop_codon:yes gene_type:complete
MKKYFLFSVFFICLLTLQAQNNKDSLGLSTDELKNVIVFIDSTSFNSQEKFEEKWNMLYPWGADHNGSARMYKENVTLINEGVLQIKAEWTHWKDEGKSKSDPHLRINFHSGAIHYKDHIKVSKKFPYWEISGDFKAPISPSSWPAFWITGVDSWPPEIDILEFKGNTTNLQNTVTGPSWNQTVWTTERATILDADTVWHHYKLILERLDDKNTLVKMYIDNNLKSREVKDFTDKLFWLIINMQMEGASGATNDTSKVRKVPQYFKGRNVYVAAIKLETN